MRVRRKNTWERQGSVHPMDPGDAGCCWPERHSRSTSQDESWKPVRLRTRRRRSRRVEDQLWSGVSSVLRRGRSVDHKEPPHYDPPRRFAMFFSAPDGGRLALEIGFCPLVRLRSEFAFRATRRFKVTQRHLEQKRRLPIKEAWIIYGQSPVARDCPQSLARRGHALFIGFRHRSLHIDHAPHGFRDSFHR